MEMPNSGKSREKGKGQGPRPLPTRLQEAVVKLAGVRGLREKGVSQKRVRFRVLER